jgi:hypothetical protein
MAAAATGTATAMADPDGNEATLLDVPAFMRRSD